jgi:Repeat of unknown function (DUF5907)
MPTLGNALDFAKYEARNIRGHQLGTAPSSPVTGQLYYNTGDNTLYWWDGTQWVSARGGAASTPDATTSTKGVIQLAGDLAGTATSPQIAAGVITDAEVAAANKDGAVGTASMRTLGSGAAQAMPGNRTLDAITAPTAPVNFNTQRLTSVGPPSASTDGANKQYVDDTAQGLDAKASVKAASVGNLTLSGTQTVDGIALIANDRVLVKDQSTPSANGIYIVQAGAWTRATDMDAWTEVPGAYTWVEQGTVNADSGWVATADQGGTLGSTSITWTQFSGAGSITAGAGLTKTGSTLDVGAGAGITVNADSIQVANNGITNAMLADAAVDLASADVTNTLPLTKGGTGQTTAKAARESGLLSGGYYSSATHGAGATISITQATHGLRSSRGLIVQVQLEADGSILLADVTIAATGDVTVTFGASQSANTIRVTIIG